eukprot:3940948-Rhodomonas_salina.4
MSVHSLSFNLFGTPSDVGRVSADGNSSSAKLDELTRNCGGKGVLWASLRRQFKRGEDEQGGLSGLLVHGDR